MIITKSVPSVCSFTMSLRIHGSIQYIIIVNGGLCELCKRHIMNFALGCDQFKGRPKYRMLATVYGYT